MRMWKLHADSSQSLWPDLVITSSWVKDLRLYDSSEKRIVFLRVSGLCDGLYSWGDSPTPRLNGDNCAFKTLPLT